MSDQTIWLIVGFVGQGVFTARFLLQWLASERRKKSVIPVMFWHFSLLGGFTLLIYAIHNHDPVFIAGQASGLLIYSRNLYFVTKNREDSEAARESNGIKS
ncbi:MAG: lipid-A-disaccharide synthase N-terminal domain-containing protein [Gammaproteobacteria bacterium]